MDSALALDKGALSLDWTMHWASHSVRERSIDEFLELDGETRRQDFRARLGLGKGVAVSVSIPYISHSGGQLDGLIDDWHAFWGMPDGPRAVQPADDLRFAYIGSPGFDLRSSRSGLGDVEVALSVEIASAQLWTLGIFAQHKFATGKPDDFSGSGEAGSSLGVRWSRRQCVFSRLSCHLQAGVSDVGESDFDTGSDTRIPFAGLSLAWQLGDALALLAQVEGHAVVYDADVLTANRAPVWGTLGLRWQLGNRWLIDAQFIEDLTVGSAPDVSFRFAVSRTF